jgi:hypothetical protein
MFPGGSRGAAPPATMAMSWQTWALEAIRVQVIPLGTTESSLPCKAGTVRIRLVNALKFATCVVTFASLMSGCSGSGSGQSSLESQNVPGLLPGATSGKELFSRHVAGGSTVSGYLGGWPACPSIHVINVVVQHGHKRQGFWALVSGPRVHPIIEINVYATFANFPRVVISHVDSSISRVAWVSGAQTYDHMTPVEDWAVEIGPFLPVNLWRVENPDTVVGELVAYRGTRAMATLPVNGPDTLPPPRLSSTRCNVS